MSEPFDGWEGLEQRCSQSRDFDGLANHAESNISENDFTFPCEGISEDDDEVTESKIKDFLDEKVVFMLEAVQIRPFCCWYLITLCFYACQAIDLKKLQSPLYEFYNTVNAGLSEVVSNVSRANNITSTPLLPPLGRSPPIKMEGGAAVKPFCDNLHNASPKSCTRSSSRSSMGSGRVLRTIASPHLNKANDKIHDYLDNPRFV
jgi:hypothetical protein